MQALQRLQSDKKATSLGGSNWHGLKILGRSRLFMKLTAITMLSGIVTEGVYELVSQFLQYKLGFNVLDMVRDTQCTVKALVMQARLSSTLMQAACKRMCGASTALAFMSKLVAFCG